MNRLYGIIWFRMIVNTIQEVLNYRCYALCIIDMDVVGALHCHMLEECAALLEGIEHSLKVSSGVIFVAGASL